MMTPLVTAWRGPCVDGATLGSGARKRAFESPSRTHLRLLRSETGRPTSESREAYQDGGAVSAGLGGIDLSRGDRSEPIGVEHAH
jgi:hypothetical protein